MAYNPQLYAPYAQQQSYTWNQPQPRQQPVNGLTFLSGGMEEAESYQMPPGSVSQPLFIDGEHFIIKTFDVNGGSSMEAYEAKKMPLSALTGKREAGVTRADLDAFKAEIMEAINAKYPVADVSAEAAAESNPR